MGLRENLKLYFIPDKEIGHGRDLVFQALEAIKGGATTIQLRAKKMKDIDIYKIGLEMRKVTAENNILFIVNDRVDIALATEANGVHLGKDDLPISIARKLTPKNFIIGVSVSNIEEAIKAQSEGADYLAVSSVFPTTSKDDVDAVGIETLKKIVKSTDLPVIGIGGINLNNLEQVLYAGACGVAIISAIAAKEDIAIEALAFKQSIMKILKGDELK